MDADALTLPELMHQLRDLVRRGPGPGRRPAPVRDDRRHRHRHGTGDRGVDTVYGVIYPPQVAMIGIGRVPAGSRWRWTMALPCDWPWI